MTKLSTRSTPFSPLGASYPVVPIEAVDKAINSVFSWLEQREKRIEAEALLNAEVKIQEMRTKDYAKELKVKLKGLKRKIEENENYLKIQMEDREKERKDLSKLAKDQIHAAHKLIDLLAKPDSPEMPSEQRKAVINAITEAIMQASRIMEKYPSGPLATLD